MNKTGHRDASLATVDARGAAVACRCATLRDKVLQELRDGEGLPIPVDNAGEIAAALVGSMLEDAMGAGGSTSARKIRGKELEVAALDLRKAGYTYRAIGKALGCSDVGAYKAVQRSLARMDKLRAKLAEDVRGLELARLDEEQNAIWEKVGKGDTQAIYCALAIQERRAKLLGLDAPQKVESTSKVSLGYENLSDEDLDAEIERAQAVANAGQER